MHFHNCLRSGLSIAQMQYSNQRHFTDSLAVPFTDALQNYAKAGVTNTGFFYFLCLSASRMGLCCYRGIWAKQLVLISTDFWPRWPEATGFGAVGPDCRMQDAGRSAEPARTGIARVTGTTSPNKPSSTAPSDVSTPAHYYDPT